MAMAVAGIPALLVGAELFGQGLDFAQLIIVVPLGAIAGGAIVGLVGRQAAASAAPGAFLFRAPLGSIGAALFNLSRLALTLAWATLILSVASRWLQSALINFDLRLPDYVSSGIVALLAIALFFNGFSWTFDFLRRRLFVLVIVLTLIVVWRLLNRSDPTGDEPLTAGFPAAIDGLLGLAIVWSTLASDAGGYGHREDETASGLGFGFAIATLAFVLAGAAVSRVGVLDPVSAFGGGLVGAILLLAWVPVMEIDGTGGLLASTTVSLQSIIRAMPAYVGLILGAGVAIVGSQMLDTSTIRDVISIVTLLVGPAVSLLLVDAWLINPGGYHSDELFRWRGEYGTFNFFGVVSWLAGAALGVWLRPDLGVLPGGPELGPAVLLGMLTSAILYWPLGRLRIRRRTEAAALRRF
jgi:purine-cytosine permease-like protein